MVAYYKGILQQLQSTLPRGEGPGALSIKAFGDCKFKNSCRAMDGRLSF